MQDAIRCSFWARLMAHPAFPAFLSAVLIFGTGCVTNPVTTRDGTMDLLNIHQAVAPTVNIDLPTAKLVFFGDLHRGMGKKDFFRDNRKLWVEILKYYHQEGFTLVLLGDIEEGWGFQPDNIPIILQWHGEEFLWEKRFAEPPENEPADARVPARYYRVYGNHDDYFRGNPLRYGPTGFVQAYPAIIFVDKASGKRIFVTHGCQGHGFHDAGDKVAAWGVFARYNWLIEILPKKEREGTFADKAEKIKADFDKHEQYVYDWACANDYDILIAGHTHRPIYDLNGVSYSYQVLKEDIGKRKFPLYSLYSDAEGPAARDKAPGVEPVEVPEMSDRVRDKMLRELEKEAALSDSHTLIRSGGRQRGRTHTEYYNPGCGYLSEIPCMELSGGRISHRYFRLGPDGRLEWKTLDPKARAMIRETPREKSE